MRTRHREDQENERVLALSGVGEVVRAVSAWLLVRLDDRLGAFEKTAVAIAQRLEDQTNRCSECKEWRQRNEKEKA